MVTTELGACEWFVYELRRSSLIDRGQLDQIVGDYLKTHPRAEPNALAEFLVRQGVLTKFQAGRIIEGKAQGLVLGPYTLMDAVGSGSMGTVFKARSKTDNQLYAVKVLPRRSMWNVRLARRQVRTFGTFGHPSVVPFVDVGTAGGLHYLVWPLVEGETLETLVKRQGKLPQEMAALYCLQVAHGLSAAHKHELFHGLLKPSNVMVGGDQQARMLDYGIGSLLAENEGESLVDTMSTANTLTSGLDCCAPESILEPTHRTPAGDQYSLGCMLYYCLTGQYPFPDGSAVEKMMAHQSKSPQPIKELNPGVSDGLIQVVTRLMQKAPEGRFDSAEEVVAALQPFALELAHGGRPAQPPAARPSPAAAAARPAKAVPAATAASAAPGNRPMPTRQLLHQEPPAPAAPAATVAPAVPEYTAPPGLFDVLPEERQITPSSLVMIALTVMVVGLILFKWCMP